MGNVDVIKTYLKGLDLGQFTVVRNPNCPRDCYTIITANKNLPSVFFIEHDRNNGRWVAYKQGFSGQFAQGESLVECLKTIGTAFTEMLAESFSDQLTT